MAIQTFDNVVLENKFNDILSTTVNLANLITVDSTLAENAGMKKKVNTYVASGEVEDLAMGEGNTGDFSVSFETKEYEVKTTQGRMKYFDEQAMTDPVAIEAGLRGMAQQMTNDFTKKAIAEFEKASTSVNAVGNLSFNTVIDAISKIPNVATREEENGLFILVSTADVPALRASFKDTLQYVEAFARTGYIGSVAGVPLITSAAVEKGHAYLATKDAVTLYIKKDVEVEQARDIDKRQNTVVIRKVAVVALTDDTKVVKIVPQGA